MPDFQIQHPYALLLLLLLPVLLLMRQRLREKISFPVVSPHLKLMRPTFWKGRYETVFFSAAFFCLCLALANPGYSRRTVEEFIESKWIILSLDLSGSMMRQASRFSNQTISDVAIDGLESFIDLRQEGDYIGLVAFSSFAKLLAPLTFDKDLLKRKLDLVRSRNQSRIYRELGAGGGTNASEAVWLAISVFFSMLPPENRLTVNELADIRTFLVGEPDTLLDIPPKVRNADFGTGMAVILFTDGRIEPRLRADVRQGRLPNLVNIIHLMKMMDIRFYIIAVGGRVDQAVVEAMDAGIGRIFPLSRGFDPEQIEEIYEEIDNLESNRYLIRATDQPRWTRQEFSVAALLLIFLHALFRALPGYRKI